MFSLKKTKEKNQDNHNNSANKIYKIALIIAAVIFILSGFAAFHAFTYPKQIERIAYENNIQQRTAYDYKIDVIPSALYPQGGTITPDNRIFTRITEGLRIKLDSSITAEEAISVKGNYKVILKINAEDYWEKEYATLIDTRGFDLEGEEVHLVQDEIYVSLSEIVKYTESLEEELGVSPSQYIIKVVPVVEGTILAGENNNPLDSLPELTFSFTPREILLTGEQEFTKDIPIREVETLSSNYKLAGISIPLLAARVVFLVISLLSLAYIVFYVIKFFKKAEGGISESVAIDRKYRSRLINLKREIEYSGQHLLLVDDFKSLIKIADEKEFPVLRYEDLAGNVGYYIIDGQCIYRYQTINGSMQRKGINDIQDDYTVFA